MHVSLTGTYLSLLALCNRMSIRFHLPAAFFLRSFSMYKSCTMNIYVSNLGFNVQSEDLKKHFSQFGEVVSVNIIMDKITKRSRGFGFIRMDDTKAAEKAIRELNGTSIDNQTIRVKEARRREG